LGASTAIKPGMAGGADVQEAKKKKPQLKVIQKQCKQNRKTKALP